VLTEGHDDDVRAGASRAGFDECDAPLLPAGPHRGRASVPAASVVALGRALERVGAVRWLAEIGVGTVHLATDSEDALREARRATEQAGGWMLREAGAPGLDGFGVDLPNAELMRRVRAAFDPDAKLAPGRLPLTRSEPQPSPRQEGEVLS
jgi:hypothetical protein